MAHARLYIWKEKCKAKNWTKSSATKKMVQKETRLGKTEKGRGGRLVLFATQTLCALFLFCLLYTEITFKGTRSQQIKCKFSSNWRSSWFLPVNKWLIY